MYLVHQPEGSDEPTRYRYEPKRLMSAEREALERRTGKNFTEFTQAVLAGNSLCRRALLHMFIKREHPTTRFDDVDFMWEELKLEWSRGELEQMRAAAAENLSGAERQAALDHYDAEIATAYEEPGEGKAPLPIVG